MKVIVGSAADSWGIWFSDDAKQMSWERYLDEVVEAGFEWIEIGPYGYLPTDVPTLRAELDKRGLKPAGNWVMAPLEEPAAWPALEQRAISVGETLASLGAKFMVLIDATYTDEHSGDTLAASQLDDEAWKQLIKATHAVADIARNRFGLRLVFHPHVDTHVQYEQQIETLLEQTDPALVELCLDTGHHAYAGGDPLEFMRRHHQRIPYLHFKNIDPKIHARVKAENIPMATAVSMGVFCELSQGAVDFIAFRDLLREVDFNGFAIYEQDMYPVAPDVPLPIAKRNRAFLREVGFG